MGRKRRPSISGSGCLPMQQEDREEVVREMCRQVEEGRPIKQPRWEQEWRRFLVLPKKKPTG